jgi:glucose/arabinose dehydrogenase
MRPPDHAPPPPGRAPLRAVLAALVVLAAIGLAVVVATRPRVNPGVGVGGPTGRPSAAGSSGSQTATGSAGAGGSIDAGGSSAPGGEASASAGAPPFDPARVAVKLVPFVSGLDAPLAIVNADDGSGRLFVAEQGGRIMIVRDGRVVATPFLDISDRITTGGERGLLGVAFHPRFPEDPRVFVDFTDRNGDTQVSSFAVRSPGGDRADPTSETRILHVDQPFANHNGGALLFDPDGMLLISLGDGGSGGDPQGNGQSLGTLLGKILRIDVGRPGADPPYSIPADNPYLDSGGRRPQIWLWGLRNPWRMSLDRATGDLWIGDVGQNAWEEVDVQRAGSPGGTNFGWNRMEGTHCYEPAVGCEDPSLTRPVSDYGHDLGCTVIGGAVYRGTAQPALAGGYVFGDYCSGRIWAIDPARDDYQSPVEVAESGANLSAFGEDEAGELFAADISGGAILRVTAERR